jgi:hypothetical protein
MGRIRYPHLINYYLYLNTRSNCFCSPEKTTKPFTSVSNTANISNYLRVANALSAGNSLKSARVSFGGGDSQLNQIQLSTIGKQFMKKM